MDGTARHMPLAVNVLVYKFNQTSLAWKPKKKKNNKSNGCRWCRGQADHLEGEEETGGGCRKSTWRAFLMKEILLMNKMKKDACTQNFVVLQFESIKETLTTSLNCDLLIASML